MLMSYRVGTDLHGSKQGTSHRSEKTARQGFRGERGLPSPARTRRFDSSANHHRECHRTAPRGARRKADAYRAQRPARPRGPHDSRDRGRVRAGGIAAAMLAQHRASPPQKVCFYGRPARASRGRDRPKAGRLTGAFQIRYVS
ncbi:hypothetical protein AQ477_20275 [Burkholderia thailandensis]|nr:hypothetical protein AQ477_20275 [Burkholderia thailandensis]KXF58064.1 hypothetical protein AQ476_25375 [Burkholderia thailandensis]